MSASRRPTGYRRAPASGTSSTTVGRPWVSRAVETTPAGLLTIQTARSSRPADDAAVDADVRAGVDLAAQVGDHLAVDA